MHFKFDDNHPFWEQEKRPTTVELAPKSLLELRDALKKLSENPVADGFASQAIRHLDAVAVIRLSELRFPKPQAARFRIQGDDLFEPAPAEPAGNRLRAQVSSGIGHSVLSLSGDANTYRILVRALEAAAGESAAASGEIRMEASEEKFASGRQSSESLPYLVLSLIYFGRAPSQLHLKLAGIAAGILGGGVDASGIAPARNAGISGQFAHRTIHAYMPIHASAAAQEKA
jgi:hypothetical protein